MKQYYKDEFSNNIPSKRFNRDDIIDKLIIHLRNISHIMRFLYEGKGSQKRILVILNENGKITQRELTEKLGIKPGSVSEVIAKLEKDGFIIRTVSEQDRRTTDVELTETGKEAAAEAIRHRKKRHEEMFLCLSDDEQNTLLSLLEKVNEDWEKRYHNAEKKHKDSPHHKGDVHHRKNKKEQKI